MNECLGQLTCCRSTFIYLSSDMVKSNETDNVRIIKRTKGLHKGDICR